MSDSDSDTSNNVFTFQNTNTIVSAKGPNINVSNLSFRNPMTSTMCMPRNFERSRYAESVCDQRSMYYRRETSPMSIRSACDVRPRNYQQYYPATSSQKSMFSGRGGSPMSVRSIDSSASVSAADIAFAFKNVKFNRYDLKVIKDAYQKLMKQKVRKRIEKRRNMRLFLKGGRRRSGYDSGELGSNSSISSDDCRSVKTSYKENMSSNASTRMNLTDFRRTVNDNTFKDCSESFKHSAFKNKFPIGFNSTNTTRNFNNSVMPSNSLQSNPFTSQKERFKNGFLLPSQRFNKSVASSVIMENSEKCYKTTANNPRNHKAPNRNNCVSGSEEEEIFSEVTVREKSPCNSEPQRKRSLDSEDECLPQKKKSRVLSPVKNDPINRRSPSKLKNHQPKNIALSNSFEFAKPSLPIRKSKPKIQEKLIAKSAQPLTDFLEPVPEKIQEPVQTVQVTQPDVSQEKSAENLSQLDQSEATQSDMSSRPSFIKRKLFTQTMDVTEKANVSTDSTNSPQSGVYLLQKEKNKARKVVTSQSCLNREVQDDSNLLDLIHKIVPRDRMNLVTPVDKVVDKTVDKTLMPKDCRILVEKLQPNDIAQKQVVNKDVNLTHNNATASSVKNSAKTFWDTDFESDAECQTILPRSNIFDSSKRANTTLGVTTEFKKPIGYANKQILKKSQQNVDKPKQLNNVSMNSTVMNNTVDISMRKFNTSTLSIRSHRVAKKPKCCNETCTETNLKVNNNNKITVENKKEKSKKPEEEPVQKTKVKENRLTNNLVDVPKAKTTKNEKANKAKSTTKMNTTVNEKPSNKNKQVVSPIKNKQAVSTNKNKQVISPYKNSNKSDLKSKTAKSSNNNKKTNLEEPNNKPAVKQSNNKTAVKKQTDTPQVKSNSKSKPPTERQQNKKDSPKAKPKSKDCCPTTNGVPPKSNNNNTIIQNTSFSGRPWRSCRTPSQSRSIELSRSTQLDTSIENNKSLRSRVINLSSSIENITINIKPKKKTNNNKNISQINTRKSDVSFSLGAGTPTPKKNIARTKTNLNRSKRRT